MHILKLNSQKKIILLDISIKKERLLSVWPPPSQSTEPMSFLPQRAQETAFGPVFYRVPFFFLFSWFYQNYPKQSLSFPWQPLLLVLALNPMHYHCLRGISFFSLHSADSQVFISSLDLSCILQSPFAQMFTGFPQAASSSMYIKRNKSFSTYLPDFHGLIRNITIFSTARARNSGTL